MIGQLVPLMIFRGHDGRRRAAEAAKAVSGSGAPVARLSVAPAPLFTSGFRASTTLYTTGIWVKQPFLAPYAVLLPDVTGIERTARGRIWEIRIVHSSPNVQSPLVLTVWQWASGSGFQRFDAELAKRTAPPMGD